MSLMYMQMGMSVLDTLSGISQANHEYEMTKMVQKHQHTMSALSTAMNLNTNTRNMVSLRDATVRAKQAVDVQSMQDAASTEAGAAAAGVRGGSVAGAMRGIMRSNLAAKHTVRRNALGQQGAMQQERKNIVLSGVMNRDISVIPKPSVASALLGLGANLIDIYDTHQPDGERTTDAMSKWWE